MDERPLGAEADHPRLRQDDTEYTWSTSVWAACPEGAQEPVPRLLMWNVREPADLTALRPNAKEPCEAVLSLRRCLEIGEPRSRLSELTPVRVLEEISGRSKRFYGHVEPGRVPVSIRWHFGFEMLRIHFDWGWREFGLRPA